MLQMENSKWKKTQFKIYKAAMKGSESYKRNRCSKGTKKRNRNTCKSSSVECPRGQTCY